METEMQSIVLMSGCLSSDDFLSSKRDDESSAIVSSTGPAGSLLELP